MLCNKLPYQTTANTLNVLMVGLVLLKVTLNCWILLVFMGNPRTPNTSTYLITRAKCCLCVSASHSSACELFNSRFSWQSLIPCCAQHLSKLQLLMVVQVPYCCGPCFMVQNVLTWSFLNLTSKGKQYFCFNFTAVKIQSVSFVLSQNQGLYCFHHPSRFCAPDCFGYGSAACPFVHTCCEVLGMLGLLLFILFS